jgi:hypothetical protein
MRKAIIRMPGSRSLSLAVLNSLMVCLLVFNFVVPYCRAAESAIVIDNGASFTNSPTVTLTLNINAVFTGSISSPEMSIDNSESSAWTNWEPYSQLRTWQLTAGDGQNSVFVRFRAITGLPAARIPVTSIVYVAIITLDTTPPTLTITNPTSTLKINSKTINLSWLAEDTGSGLDYVKIADGYGNVIFTGTGNSYTLTELNNGYYYYTVEAYDNAGNFRSDSLDFTVDIIEPSFPWMYLIAIIAVVGVIVGAIVMRRPGSTPKPKVDEPRPRKEDDGKDQPSPPSTLLIGDFEILVEKISTPIPWKTVGGITKGVSGTGLVSFKCSGLPQASIARTFDGFVKIKDSLKVVDSVVKPQTEISLDSARLVKPDIKLGDNLVLDMRLTSSELHSLLERNQGIANYLISMKGDVLVEFVGVTVENITHQLRDVGPLHSTGRIIEGKARALKKIELYVDNFVLLVDNLILTPTGATADIKLRLPENIASGESCEPATLDVGNTNITPDCQIYAEKPSDEFGPWIIGDTGMMAKGNGYVVDFNTSPTPPAVAASLKGVDLKPGMITGKKIGSGNSNTVDTGMHPSRVRVVLNSGEATGEQISHASNSNTGFVTGKYYFSNAEVIGSGLDATFNLKEKHIFNTLQPLDYIISMNEGNLYISGSQIISGELGDGKIEFPPISICPESARVRGETIGSKSSAKARSLTINKNLDILEDARPRASATFQSLTINKNLDLVGDVSFKDEDARDKRNAWGELTNIGNEVLSWSINIGEGYLYLPSGPKSNFSPDNGKEFHDFPQSLSSNYLELNGIEGVTIFAGENDELEKRERTLLNVYSPDGSEGIKKPLDFRYYYGWLRIGSYGVDGELRQRAPKEVDLGYPERDGYVPDVPFDSTIHEVEHTLGQFVDSAVYDSCLNGDVNLPYPCGFKLDFADMEFTSTANLVGGKIMLREDIRFEHWDLVIRPVKPEGMKPGEKAEVGVISVRTGRLILTNVEILERLHFLKGFRVLWGEIFADGNIGEFFFDYNNYGQEFDELPYNPHQIKLSPYDKNHPGDDAYLATCGGVCFNFFGEAFVNIKDAKDATKNSTLKFCKKCGELTSSSTETCASAQCNSADWIGPLYHRHVTDWNRWKNLGTVDAQVIPGTEWPPTFNWNPTDLHLHGRWNNDFDEKRDLAEFDFPDEIMGYNDARDIQFGFTGQGGKTDLSFLRATRAPEHLMAKITTARAQEALQQTEPVLKGTIDIELSTEQDHALNFSKVGVNVPLVDTLHAPGADKLIGTIKITGPKLDLIKIHGVNGNTASEGTWIFNVSGGTIVTVNLSITPTSCDFTAVGNFSASIVEQKIIVDGTTHLLVDYAIDSVQGDLSGKVECDTFIKDFKVSGQLNWFLSDHTKYLQGRISLTLPILPFRGEGGFFIGQNCPSEKAIILHSTGNEHLHVHGEILKGEEITGIYGYGILTISEDFGIFSGGIDGYMGLGYVLTKGGLAYISVDGIYIHGEILWGLVSASAWGVMDTIVYAGELGFAYGTSGDVGLRGCIAWVLCASIELGVSFDTNSGFDVWRK